VSIGAGYPAGSGLETPGGLRLQYAFPENAGVSSYRLQKAIDSIVNAGLRAGAFPGCEVMAARRGMVIFHQTYGHHTYDRRIAVEEGDLYDLASVTKVSGPLSGLMWLEGAGKFSHEEKLGTYCPEMKRSDKASLPLKDILAHQAGLYPWIPYWQDAVRNNGEYRKRFLRYAEERRFPLTVADHLYLKYNYNRKIFKTIRKSELGERTYLYSGLAFFLFPGIIEDLSGERYEDFLYRHIYHRIGAWDLVFNPTRFYSPRRIVPTEYDSTFRKQQVHGYVHDEGAAMMGGYSGNAGLFATAGDLMKLMEMYRRMGTYGGEQIIPAGVLREYTSYQFPETKNRRGLGFDKPLLDERDGTPADYPCPGASPSSFGHSGFTGTFVWVDPEAEITYVFLSNRVYPTRENNLISEMDIRTSILQGIYDAIDSSD
jgi:CubicO group peptidase (beta-lactamase class C family)